MVEGQVFVGVVTAVLTFLGTWLIFRGTKGKTQADYRTAMETRIDRKVEEYTKKLESRLEAAEKKNDDLTGKYNDLNDKYDDLADKQEKYLRRESILYRYTVNLRNHILGGYPPPPPPLPAELEEWFEDLEGTYPPLT